MGTKRSMRIEAKLLLTSIHLSVKVAPHRGAVAQLGERLNGIQEVVGSTPISSTILFQLLRRSISG